MRCVLYGGSDSCCVYTLPSGTRLDVCMNLFERESAGRFSKQHSFQTLDQLCSTHSSLQTCKLCHILETSYSYKQNNLFYSFCPFGPSTKQKENKTCHSMMLFILFANGVRTTAHKLSKCFNFIKLIDKSFLNIVSVL